MNLKAIISEEKPVFSTPVIGKAEQTLELVQKDITFGIPRNEIKIHYATLSMNFKISCAEYHHSKNCSVICIPPADGRYSCGKDGEKICRSGLGGSDCDEPSEECKSTCKNGMCDSNGICRCYSGYKGQNCDQVCVCLS